MRAWIRKYSNYFGFGALAIWAIEPLFVSEINNLPVFELLAIVFLSAFLFTGVRLTYRKRWSLVLRQPIWIWLGGFIGICVSDFAYIYASQFAPIAHVDLIDYLWPCFAILFTAMLPKERLRAQHIVAMILGLLGIYLLVGKQISSGLDLDYAWGYFLAIFGALIWGGYSAFSRFFHRVPTEMVGIYCGMGFVASLGLHLQFETFVVPTAGEGIMLVLMGILGAGIAYQFWDHGVKYGNVYLLSNLTYLARMLGMALLVTFDKEPFSMALVGACVLSSFGVYLSSMESDKFHRISRFILPSRLFRSSLPESAVPEVSERVVPEV